MGVAGVGFIAFRYVTTLSKLSSDQSIQLGWALLAAVAGFTAFVWFLFAMLIRYGGRGPTQIYIGEAGFSIVWSDGSSRAYNWKRILTAIDLREFREPHNGLGACGAASI
jgi:hypothetical protein